MKEKSPVGVTDDCVF